ncbi:MAG: K(+)-transporting ATPase subunit C [Thermodesulfobacteriota bacterium]
MKSLLEQLETSVRATVVLALIVCGIYPVVVWAVAQGVFPHQANGSLVATDRENTGSRLIGQSFAGDRYFHPRPSAAGQGYDAADSGGSNLGPLSKELHQTIADRVRRYRSENGLSQSTLVPADAVTASASGLDPHISPANAQLQARRIAKARSMTEGSVKELIEKHTEGRTFGIFGDPRINVLTLNLALDRQK